MKPKKSKENKIVAMNLPLYASNIDLSSKLSKIDSIIIRM